MGGQWQVAGWVNSFLPSNLPLVDVFGGGASVLLQRVSDKDIRDAYNDLDGRNVNFFRCLRDHPISLIELVSKKLFNVQTVEELSDALVLPYCNIDLAAAYYEYSHCTFRGAGDRWHSKYVQEKVERYKRIDHSYLHYWNKRLTNIPIYNVDAREIIHSFAGSHVLYLDPPFPNEVRKGKDSRHKDQAKALTRYQYKCEYSTRQQEELLSLLVAIDPIAAICSYQNPLYDSYLLTNGWCLEQKQVGSQAGKRILCLYLSPKLKSILISQDKL